MVWEVIVVIVIVVLVVIFLLKYFKYGINMVLDFIEICYDIVIK